MKGFRSALFLRKRALLASLGGSFSSAASRFLCLFLAAIFTLLAGCMRNEPEADVIILNLSEPESLDPAIIVGQADGRVSGSLFEGLTRFEPTNGFAVPGLAHRWTISPDGVVYTFFLRSNLTWSTGEPIEAEDFVYSWRRVVNPETASSYVGQLFFVTNAEEIATAKIKDVTHLGIKALDRHTLEVRLIGPTPFFLDQCAFRTLAVVPRHWIEKHKDNWVKAQPVPTSGPYTLEAWRVNDRIRVRKNPRYWDVVNVRNDIVDFLPIESATAAFNLYDTCQADFIIDKTLVPAELMDVLRHRADCLNFDYLSTYFFRINTTRKPFDDPRVRKALALSIDKQRIVDRITRGGEKTASILTPPRIANYTRPEGLGYNPDLARKLLAEAGYTNGVGFRRFEYHFNTAELHKQIAVELQEMWRRELGITMVLRQVEWKVYLADQDKLNYDLTRSAWVGDYNDPNTYLDLFMSNNGNNRTGWQNAKYDELVRRANAQADRELRAKILADAERILVVDELPIVPIYYYQGAIFFDPDELEGIWGNLLDEHPIWSIKRKRSRPEHRPPLPNPVPSNRALIQKGGRAQAHDSTM